MITTYDTIVYLDGSIIPEVKRHILIGAKGEVKTKTIYVRLELHNTLVGLVHKRASGKKNELR
jgi:hypothetical protein